MISSDQKALLIKAHTQLLMPEYNDPYDLAVLEDLGLVDRSLFLTDTGRPLASILARLTSRQLIHLEVLYFKGYAVEDLCEIFRVKEKEIEAWLDHCVKAG